VEGTTLNQIFTNFSRKLIKAKVVEEAKFEEVAPSKYVLHIDRCIYAEDVHSMLKPKDVICPWALIAMAIFEMAEGKRVKNAWSEYSELGSKTRIEY
jgi:hypothetical protein